MKKFVHTFYLAVISILAIGVWQLYTSYNELSVYANNQAVRLQQLQEREPSNASLNPISGEREPNSASLVPSCDELLERVAWLELELEARDAELTALAEGEYESEGRSRLERQQGALSEEETAAFRHAIRAAMEGHLSGDDMAVRSAEEPVDPNWAYPVEQALQDFFISQEDMRDFMLTEVDCRTSYCQLTVASNGATKNFPTELLHRHLMEQEWFGTGMIMSFNNPETGEATVIIQARENTPPQ